MKAFLNTSLKDYSEVCKKECDRKPSRPSCPGGAPAATGGQADICAELKLT